MGRPLAAFLVFCAAQALGQDLLDDLIFYDVNLGNRIAMGPVNPETVLGYEILYAAPGAGDISEIAGHLLLRVKLNNNPKAAALGIQNPNDLVISFLADTEAGKPPRDPRPLVVQVECKKNNWFNLVANNNGDESPLASIWQSLRGLSGGFLFTMDRQTLGHAIKSYTIEQDRDLLRYQLDLTEKQRLGLLARLYDAKAGPKPSYYFFSQNCGSVLVRVIAEGIGDDLNAAFSPLVSPPHTLLGNLVRDGLAHRVTPAFHSYRKQGFIAHELFSDRFSTLRAEFSELPWPSLRDLNHPCDFVRAGALAQLSNVVYARPHLGSSICALAALAQEKDMVHAYKGIVCEKYTSESTAEARKLQAHILRTAKDKRDFRVDTDQLLNDHFSPREAAYARAGTAHTELYPLAFGPGFVQVDGESGKSVLTFDGALLNQDLGSRSRIAMQRSSAATLGGVSGHIGDGDLREWQITGLTLRKFRDTLNSVPSAFTSARGLGLGLTVLDVHHSAQTGKTRTNIAGIEALANIISTPNYNDFLLVSIGVELTHQDKYEVGIPIGFEHLWSFDDAMKWQWRNTATYDVTTGDRFSASSSLAVRLGDVWNRDVLLRLGADYKRERGDRATVDTVILKAQLELNRW